MKKILATLVATATLAIVATVGTVSANDDINWTFIPATEVAVIDNVDFLYTDNGICWGLTYNGGEWIVETITGEYNTIYSMTPGIVNGYLEVTPKIGCDK